MPSPKIAASVPASAPARMVETRIAAKNVGKAGIVESTYPMASRRASAAAVHPTTSATALVDRGWMAGIGSPGKTLLPGLGIPYPPVERILLGSIHVRKLPNRPLGRAALGI